MDQEQIALDLLQTEIAKRLRGVCVHIPESELDRYVERLAFVERSYQIADDLEPLGREQQAPGEQSQ